MAKDLIVLKDVSFHRETKMIFKNLSISIPKNKITCVMGPSGTGKTTLLRLITGQVQPDSGTVQLDSHTISDMNRRKLYILRRRMGILFQEGALFTDLNVFDNVAFPLRAHTDLPESLIKDLVLMKLEAVGLRGAAYLQTSELSGGMSRRVALARAIAMDPSIMMYDEPFTGQDPITRGVLIQLIRKINDALGLTSVLVTHDVNEAKQLADQIIVLSQGELLGAGTPDEILNHPSPAIHQFIHGLPTGAVSYNYPAKQSYAEDLGL